MGKIKILHIIKSLGRGGAEMLLPETLKMHDPSRFEFHYIYFLPWKNQMVLPIEQNGGKVHNISADNNLQIIRKFREVVRYCKMNKIDIIHCHLPWSGFVGRLVHWQTRIPLIYSEHNIQERYHPVTKILNRLTFNFQSLALGVSGDVTQSIQDSIRPKIPFKSLLNGVNTQVFKKDAEAGAQIKRQYSIPQEAIVVGNIAVFRKQKNLHCWLEAFQRIVSRHQEVYGLLVGSGPMEEDIKKLSRDMGLTDRLRFPGLQKNTIPYFSAMDIFMMSSDFEGLPIALLEAMSMNCAVVATRAGGVVEAVRNEREGFLTEIKDSEALASKVTFLIQESDQLEVYKVAARERVEEAFSMKRMVQELEKTYISLHKVEKE